MKKNLVITLFVGLVLTACSWSVPDGWTAASWRDYAEKYPKCADAAKFIQSSSKRRQQRDIYLNVQTDKPSLIDGHAASVDISRDAMTGREFSQVKSWVHFFLMGVSVEMSDASSRTFTENMINRIERDIKKAESNYRSEKAYFDDWKDDPSPNTREKLHESETRIQEVQRDIKRYQEAIEKIRQIGE